ncbi:hypothetical protein TREMEDRAFT_31258 [Tremella mesenterica DSM 1558]|uniref:uncharacterized protein n=1 Tax=Tremella mesenterica (strain ATCC 24925 / CBS 8224 / DSM 1558 / NBRC 9311 / NRRL Y-6157 / RJB 2259-6 / UBC 559-6) TaxID=578456 RepID=UPI0003F49B74|nr:uncharacterized protein TREMEDRAFT_31258 [Tremella mesenterica DSM 1558]EIW69211.1 hypothetical protein TREMEDRAFT_31258 [Tremella mesenterica DSM 1558]
MTAVKRGSEDDIRGQGYEGGKKKRVSLSCAQCENLTCQCNRQFPCQHCTQARKVPELCVPYNPQSSNNSSGLDPKTAGRIDMIESVLGVVVGHTPGISGYDVVKEWMAEPKFRQLLSASNSPASSPKFYEKPHSTAGPSGSNNDSTQEDHSKMGRSASLEDDRAAGIDNTWLPDLDGGEPNSMNGKSGTHLKLDIHGTPAENLRKIVTEFGVSPHKVQELVQELPPKPFADRVIDWYFTKLDCIRHPIDERSFRNSYEELYSRLPTVDPSHCRVLPLLFIVLAVGVRLAPEPWAGSEDHKKLSSLRMYWSSRRSMLLATAIEPESLELVSAMYLVVIHDRRLTECWSQLGASLRTAQALGLHRDGSKLGLDPFQTEYRRRLWSYLYHADKLYSLILGRPPSISDEYTDTLPPSNLELSDLYDLDPSQSFPESKPLSQPTTATFLILRKGLAKIIGRIVHHFQKLNEPAQYADVEGLQHELDGFVQALPEHFRMHDPDRSLDKDNWWLPVHRFLLLTEVLVTTIVLHRPWLLRKLSSNRYAASRTACFEAAKLDFQIRQEFRREVPDHKLLTVTSQFKMFNSAMIAGISAIIDPRGPDADQMRRILTAFLEQNPWTEVKTKDETTRKEVQIILTLSRRAAKLYEESFPPGELNPQDSDSVALLLALRQSGDAPTQTLPTDSSLHQSSDPRVPPPSDPRRLPEKGRSWMTLNSTSQLPLTSMGPHPISQSPSSSTGPEDDHSQRLLDHWLHNNSALPISMANPPMGFETGGYMPMPALALGMGMTSLSGGYQDTSFGYSGWTGMGTPGPTNMGTPITQQMDYAYSGRMEGTPVMDGNMPLGEEGNSDEYWNALIDGE